MGKPLSWKWKLSITGVVLALCAIGFFLSSPGQDWLAGKMLQYIEETPEAERRDSPWAGRWLALAWWRGNVLMDTEASMEMYRQFCGLPKSRRDDTFFQTYKLSGPLTSEDGKTGWGPMHPRAPEAYFAYLELFEPLNSSQRMHEQCLNYYRLFYTWVSRHSDNFKPHPYFKKYWPQIKEFASKRSGLGWQEIDPRAPMAEEPPKEE